MIPITRRWLEWVEIVSEPIRKRGEEVEEALLPLRTNRK